MLILVVDDSRSVRVALCDTLQKNGFAVMDAKDGKEAVLLAAEHLPDLITMDVDMPELGGFEACAQIRAAEVSNGRLTPIVFVTGKDSLANRERGFSMGAAVFVSKKIGTPWDEVARIVGHILRPSELPGHFTVLVADSDELARMVMTNSLLQHGAQVIEASSGPEALALAQENLAAIDMIIVDYRLPMLWGNQLISSFRHKLGLYNIPIIIVSQMEYREEVLDIFRAGATDYISKPFVEEEFLARVSSHLAERRLVKELTNKILELESLNKLRDEFLAIASHDLKSPLTTIMGFTQILIKDDSCSENCHQMLGTILSSSDFMLETINDVVELNRNEKMAAEAQLAPMNVVPPANMAAYSLQQTALAKGVVLELITNNQNIVIEGDSHKFMRILNNLLSNAIKFTPAGGRVTISLEVRGEQVFIKVSDTGIGIPEEFIPCLFDRYTKASRRGTNQEPGTGLGMSITKQLVDHHNGKIEIENTSAEGTCFRLSFPIASC